MYLLLRKVPEIEINFLIVIRKAVRIWKKEKGEEEKIKKMKKGKQNNKRN